MLAAVAAVQAAVVAVQAAVVAVQAAVVAAPLVAAEPPQPRVARQVFARRLSMVTQQPSRHHHPRC